MLSSDHHLHRTHIFYKNPLGLLKPFCRSILPLGPFLIMAVLGGAAAGAAAAGAAAAAITAAADHPALLHGWSR